MKCPPDKIRDSFGMRYSEIIDLSLLQIRIEFLSQPERTWLELYWFKNCSPKELAHMQCVNVSTMRRRIKLLTGRLMGHTYIRFMRARLRFTTLQMAMAYDRYILGMGYRSTARKRGVTEWSARCEIKGLERSLEEMEAKP